MRKLIGTILGCLLSLTLLAQSDFGYNDYDGMGDPNQEEMAQDSTEREIAPFHRIAWRWAHDGVYREFVPIDTSMDGIHNANVIFKQSVANT